jgi:hypothetical protein
MQEVEQRMEQLPRDEEKRLVPCPETISYDPAGAAPSPRTVHDEADPGIWPAPRHNRPNRSLAPVFFMSESDGFEFEGLVGCGQRHHEFGVFAPCRTDIDRFGCFLTRRLQLFSSEFFYDPKSPINL